MKFYVFIKVKVIFAKVEFIASLKWWIFMKYEGHRVVGKMRRWSVARPKYQRGGGGHESKIVTQLRGLRAETPVAGGKIFTCFFFHIKNSNLKLFNVKFQFKRHGFSSANVHKISIKTIKGLKLFSHSSLWYTTELRPGKKYQEFCSFGEGLVFCNLPNKER